MSNSTFDLKRGSVVDEKVLSTVADEKVLFNNEDGRISSDIVAIAAIAEDTVEAVHQCKLKFNPKRLYINGN
jgi:hypothetical protein